MNSAIGIIFPISDRIFSFMLQRYGKASATANKKQ